MTSPRPLLGRRAAGFLREAALVNAAILVYFGIRNLTEGAVGTAFANARGVVRLEEALSLGWERSIQAAIEGTSLVTLANWVYIWAHWPVIITTGVALFVLRRDRYRILRNAMFVSGAIGFAFFASLVRAPRTLLQLPRRAQMAASLRARSREREGGRARGRAFNVPRA